MATRSVSRRKAKSVKSTTLAHKLAAFDPAQHRVRNSDNSAVLALRGTGGGMNAPATSEIAQEPQSTRGEAQPVWSILDDTDVPMRKAKALLIMIKIALLNPDHQLHQGDVVDSLNVLGDLLDAIGNGISQAQGSVKP